MNLERSRTVAYIDATARIVIVFDDRDQSVVEVVVERADRDAMGDPMWVRVTDGVFVEQIMGRALLVLARTRS